ncbi:MAG: hypothetical protein M3N18_10350 [Actinomycetota bacterium]|nr:hypothetical protein [Actinomycetota bacterium]
MRDPERFGRAEERLSPEARRQVMRAALLRPMHLLVVAIGAAFFALTLEWWVIPLTLATYAALIFLAPHDQIVRDKLLERRENRPRTRPGTLKGTLEERDSLEQRTRRLRRGETRRKLESALEVYRRTVFAVEESDDTAKVLLSDAVPKLRGAAERLVGIAEEREEAVGTGRDADLEEMEKGLRAADAEISNAFERFSTLRARVLRVSAESGGAAHEAAAELNAELDELNLRLDALRSTVSNPEPPADR